MNDLLLSPIRLSELELLIQNSVEKAMKNKSIQPEVESDHWFDLNELCIYLPDKPKNSTVYSWVHSGLIPYHKGAKKLRFLKSEIDDWLKTGKQKSKAEIESEADQYLIQKKGGKPS